MAGLLSFGRKRVLSSNTDILPSSKSVRVGDEAKNADSEMTVDDVAAMGRVGHITNIFTDEEEDSKVRMFIDVGAVVCTLDF